MVKLRHFAARDVGRIGNDDIERADAVRGRHGRVRFEHEHAVLHAEAVGVLARQPQRPVRQVGREHSGVLDLVRRCDADAARAAAQVENARRNARLRLLDGQLAQLFRVRARNEHGFVYAEGQSVEIPLAQNIRERLAAEHAVAQQTRVIHGRVVEIGVRPADGMVLVRPARERGQLPRGHRGLRVAAVAQPVKQLKIYVIYRFCHFYRPRKPIFLLSL